MKQMLANIKDYQKFNPPKPTESKKFDDPLAGLLWRTLRQPENASLVFRLSQSYPSSHPIFRLPLMVAKRLRQPENRISPFFRPPMAHQQLATQCLLMA
ncbi:hypothetical protein [Kingella sp. (in: b-proteobacteria)]|uniref:hypothetical protein n=1 Tax=Kingella sp. (in: b-proteobacteria) TaxID=2020713 RepID=UPI0026DBD27B|nr:hypothetical protein [Kingella sp. (in: b-proteobacteria)]MDO4658138.1 hypothetical protein [Kingella sp. (in: b-proteobacteria)]